MKDAHTFITLVKYHQGQGPDDIVRHLNTKMQKFQGKVSINLVAVTWGIADTVIVWQAKDLQDAKEFRNDPTADIGSFTTMVSAISDLKH